MRSYALLVVFFVASCSVESDKVPEISSETSPESISKVKVEIKSALADIQESTAFVGKVQNIIRRGLAEKGMETQRPGDTFQLFETSESDDIKFDKAHPEQFEYRLKNSTSLNFTTRSGGNVEILLSGTIDDTEGKFVIRDAHLEVIHQKGEEKKVFKIFYKVVHQEEQGESVEWLVDLRQLSELYVDMGGEDEGVANLQGVLEITISESNTKIKASDFTMKSGTTVIAFDKVDINISKKDSHETVVDVNGRVLDEELQRASFSIKTSEKENSSEITVKVKVDAD